MDIFQPSAPDHANDSGILSLVETLGMLRGLVVPDAAELQEHALCEHVVQVFVEHRDIETCAIYLLDGADVRCAANASRSDPRAELEGSLGSIHSESAQAAIDTNRLLVRSGLPFDGVSVSGSLIAAPLSACGRAIGALVVWHSSGARYSPWHERLIQLSCDILTQALEHGRLARGQQDRIERCTQELTSFDASLAAERRLRSAAETALRDECRMHLQQARIDPLTGLLNRGAFEHELMLTMARLRSEGEACALLYIDIDRFRVINDAAGPAAGDRLIQVLADLFQRRFRDQGVLGRLGNDEFAILLERTGGDRALAAAEALCDRIDAFQFSFRGYRFVISLSIGVAECVGRHDSAERLMRMAYSACLNTQELGGGNVRVFRETDAKLQRRSGEAYALSQLVRALEDDRLELFCQAIVSTGSPGDVPPGGEPINYEILLRLKGEDGDLITPGNFLPIAERYGLSVKLDRWVVNAVLRTLAEHAGQFDRFGYVTINLSGHSLGSRGFFEFVVEQLRLHEVVPQKLCFEVTETVAISDLASARQFIDGLKAMGCQFALDDFGSGYASYLYLRDLEVDFLKIDGEFVQGIATDSANLALIRSINDIGKILGKRTIAEHVENETTLRLLQEIGIDYVQGYFIGRPQPLASILGASGRT